MILMDFFGQIKKKLNLKMLILLLVLFLGKRVLLGKDTKLMNNKNQKSKKLMVLIQTNHFNEAYI